MRKGGSELSSALVKWTYKCTSVVIYWLRERLKLRTRPFQGHFNTYVIRLSEQYCGVMEVFTTAAAAHFYEQYVFLFPANLLLLHQNDIMQ